MNSEQLFLGFVLTIELSEKIKNADCSLRQLFFHSETGYLQQIQLKGQIYLGKKIFCPIEFTSLESVKRHIISLIERLLPEIKKFNPDFLLLTLSENHE